MPDDLSMMTVPAEGSLDRVGQAIRFLVDHSEEAPTLESAAAHVGLSPSHFQRLFSRSTGVSPKRFLRCLAAEHAKARLSQSAPVLDAAFSAGLSGPGRLHDLMVTLEAMTPGEYARQGAGLDVRYGVVQTPFGEAFIGVTDRGVCALAFLDPHTADEALDWARDRYPLSRFIPDREAAEAVARQAFTSDRPDKPLHLLVKGTNFQVQVWRALLAIPEGCLTSYGRIAKALGRPTAARAVGSAVGANPISLLIPCHRVLRETGLFSGYAWGTEWKRTLIAWEGARVAAE